jgi:hypothetical protein
MQKLYRTDYEGEFVIDGYVLKEGRRYENREFIPNTIVNNQHTGRAVVIGNGTSRLAVDLRKIERHAGGHLGKRRLQSYGCNALYRDINPDFLVSINNFMVNEIVNNSYADNNVVLSNTTNCINHPNKIHLIPYAVSLCAGAIALYLACFDGHKNVYMLGYDNQDGESNNNVYAGTDSYAKSDHKVSSKKWEGQIKRIIDTYDDVDFIWVAGGTSRFPEDWKYCVNLRQATVRDFVLEVDL